MGSLKAELRRFERRRLRPILRTLKRTRPEPRQPTGSPAAMEQLLAALIRSELRRAESKPHVWSALAATLHARLVGIKPTPRDLDGLVRTMLATPIPTVSRNARRDGALITRSLEVHPEPRDRRAA